MKIFIYKKIMDFGDFLFNFYLISYLIKKGNKKITLLKYT